SFAAAAREAGLRASVYLGSSGKLGRQLKWASDQGARWALIYGTKEDEAGAGTVRGLTARGPAGGPGRGAPRELAGPARAGGRARRRGGSSPIGRKPGWAFLPRPRRLPAAHRSEDRGQTA